jgi:hypothetical protein
MNIRIGNATFSVYEDNPHFVIINNWNSTDIIEVAIAVFTPAESDYGESHVIEHCIASDLSMIVGNLEVAAYVFHNITFLNFNIQKSNIYLLSNVMEKLFNPEFLVDENIYFRESHNVQSDSRGKRVGGIVFNEILEIRNIFCCVIFRNY